MIDDVSKVSESTSEVVNQLHGYPVNYLGVQLRIRQREGQTALRARQSPPKGRQRRDREAHISKSILNYPLGMQTLENAYDRVKCQDFTGEQM